MTWVDLAKHLPLVMTAVGGLGVGGLLKAWLDHRRGMRKATDEVAMGLVTQLTARVDKLESDLSNQRDHYEVKIERLQATYEANQRVARHELGNVKMRFRALVMLLKRLPDQSEMLVAILSDIQEMEAEQAKAEAAEKGAQSGVRIATASGASA